MFTTIINLKEIIFKKYIKSKNKIAKLSYFLNSFFISYKLSFIENIITKNSNINLIPKNTKGYNIIQSKKGKTPSFAVINKTDTREKT